MEKRTHKSQFAYSGDNADGNVISLTERDQRIFRLLDPEHRFHYLPTNWIHGFVGGDELRLAKRLGRLARAPHSYLARRQQWYKHAVYSRTSKTDRLLGENRNRDRDPFPHRLLQDLVQASIELGLQARGDLKLVHWLDLAATGKVPASTIGSAEPHAIPLSDGCVIPDGEPFAIVKENAWRFVLGKEIDRGSEPLVGAGARRSIRQKYSAYLEIFERRTYATHYGFPNAVVLFVTTSRARMDSMVKLCAEVIGPCSYLLFAHTKDWAIEPSYPPPNGDLLGPYERVGHPPLHLANFE